MKTRWDLVLCACAQGHNGDIFVQKAPASTIRTLAEALLELYKSKSELRIIGTRHGEKKYETLVNREEMVKAEDLGDYFRIPVRRKVDKDRTVTLDGRLYEAPVGLMGTTVTLLYHAEDPHRVEIWHDEQSAGFLVPLDQAINSRIRRDKSLKPELEHRPSPVPAP
ncbi:MAG: polysaccharide biosynthesis protein, partial [bacterium]